MTNHRPKAGQPARFLFYNLKDDEFYFLDLASLASGGLAWEDDGELSPGVRCGSSLLCASLRKRQRQRGRHKKNRCELAIFLAPSICFAVRRIRRRGALRIEGHGILQLGWLEQRPATGARNLPKERRLSWAFWILQAEGSF